MTFTLVRQAKVIPFPVILRHYDVPVNPGAVLLFNAAGRKIPIVADNRAVHILEKTSPEWNSYPDLDDSDSLDDLEVWASPGDGWGENIRSEACSNLKE